MGKKKRDKRPADLTALPDTDKPGDAVDNKSLGKDAKPADVSNNDQNKVSQSKKKKKQKNAEVTKNNGVTALENVNETDSSKELKKKKKKKKLEGEVLSENKEQLQSENSQVTEGMKKNKKKKNKQGTVSAVVEQENKSHKAKEDMEGMAVSELGNLEGDKRKKKKKKQGTGQLNTSQSDSVQSNNDWDRKKKQGTGQLNTSQSDSVQSNNDSGIEIAQNEDSKNEVPGKSPGNKKNKKKRKPDGGKNEADNDEEPLFKKKKDNSNEAKEQIGEAKNVDTEKENEEEKQEDFGQWSASAFEDTERQEKFIRLLGGKKNKDKNISGIQQKLFSIGMSDVEDFKSEKISMNWKQQDDYIATMESQYKRAREMNHKRGRGFGYRKPAWEGKKFHIDTGKNRSKKFD